MIDLTVKLQQWNVGFIRCRKHNQTCHVHRLPIQLQNALWERLEFKENYWIYCCFERYCFDFVSFSDLFGNLHDLFDLNMSIILDLSELVKKPYPFANAWLLVFVVFPWMPLLGTYAHKSAPSVKLGELGGARRPTNLVAPRQIFAFLVLQLLNRITRIGPVCPFNSMQIFWYD